MSSLRSAAVLAGAAALALTATACSSSASSSSSGSGTNFVSGTGEITAVKQGHRQAAPTLSGKTVDGDTLDVADYRGKIVVLNIWGSWCSPCRAEAKNLVTVADDTKSKGVQFIGINTRDLQTAQAKAFEKEFKVGYPSLYDPRAGCCCVSRRAASTRRPSPPRSFSTARAKSRCAP